MKNAEKNGKPVPRITDFEAEVMWIVNGGDPKAAFLINKIANEADPKTASLLEIEAMWIVNGGDPKAAFLIDTMANEIANRIANEAANGGDPNIDF